MNNLLLTKVTPQGQLYFRKNTLQEITPVKRISTKIDTSNIMCLVDLFGIEKELLLKAINITGKENS
jgi:Sec7-like guanine-nucleotide exchange factor